MRRFLFMAATAALVLTSCSEDKEIGKLEEKGSEIAFRSFIDKGAGTRATVTDGNNILGFTVTAWWDKKTEPDAPEIGSPDSDKGGYLFNAFDITRREASIGNWDYDPKLYWPTKGSGVYFYAYSPASSKNVAKDDNSKGLYNYEGNELEYIVPDPGKNESQEDFLLAQTGKLAGGAVNLNFAHALSRVTFSAKKGTSDLTYLIKSVELLNINKKGTIDLEKIPTDGNFTYTSTAIPVVHWTSEDPGDIKVDLGDNGSPIYVQKDYSSILGSTNALMVMPQETEAGDPDNLSGFLVKILYKAYIDVDDPGTYYAGTTTSYKEVYFKVLDSDAPNGSHVFEIGRQYNFALTFGTDAGSDIGFSVNVGDWSDAPQIDLPQIADYWKAGLISPQLAYAVNTDYMNTGVSMDQILSKTKILVEGATGSDALKGLDYFRNLQTLYINGSSDLVLDLSSSPSITKVEMGLNVSFAKMDISGRKENPLTFEVRINNSNGNGGSSGQNSDNTVIISELIVWDGFEKIANSTGAIFIISGHSNNVVGKTQITKITAVAGGQTNEKKLDASQSANYK